MFPSKSESLPKSFRRFGAFLTLALLAATLSYSTSTASLKKDGKLPGANTSRGKTATKAKRSMNLKLPVTSVSSSLLPQANLAETVATYAADCTTPKTVFHLGETVCAKTTGVTPVSPAQRSLTWSNPLVVVQRTDLENSADDTFTIPTSETSVIDSLVIDNRGTWRVNLVPAGRSVVRASAFFTVQDPQNPATDLNVYNSVDNPEGLVPAGTNVTVRTIVTNFGPDDATNVELNEAVPSNASFVSDTQDSGPSFNCVDPSAGGTGSSVCTIATLAKGAQAEFTFIYEVNAGAPKGTLIASLATVTSDTGELRTGDNSWTAKATVTDNANAVICAVGCPANITVGANTTQNNASGAIVTFASDIESSGDCGTVSANPASGSFFPVGTTSVSVNSSTGGGSCSFTVTVVDTPAPSITCAADQTAQATGSELEVSVNVNAPTATGNNVQTTGARSDNRALDDPYPVGTTTITWTARECNDPPDCSDPFARSATCTQKIIVTSSDAPTISCPNNKTFTASGCETTLTSGQIGTPTTSGTNVTVDSDRSDHLALTDPFPTGQTVITWTATDDAGRVASCNQVITVNSTGSDTTPPTLNVPANINTTTTSCSLVLDDELGVATADDNCSSSVSIVRTGVPVGFVFPTGTTTITYTATDGSGNHTTGTQTVTVLESPAVPPTITAPADLTFNTGAGATSCGTFVGDATLGTASANDNCPGVTVARTGVPSGNIFPVGTTTVTYTATDASGNTASANQTVTVADDTPPIVTAPAAVTLFTGTGATSCGVTVSNLDGTLGTGSATDNCSGVGAVTRTGVASGNEFPVGTTTLTYSATDAHGNSASATQVVTVVDNTLPIVTAPAAITLLTGPGAASCGVTVSNLDATFGTGSATDNCPGVGPVTRTGVPSGNNFPVGTTTLTYSATDAHGNTGSATQLVTVVDNTAPIISCPASITLEPTCPSGAVGTYTAPTGTDNCPGATTTRTAGLASGSVFPIGTSTVTYTANDAHGNSASCSFTVTVLTPQVVVQNLISSVNASSLTGTQKTGLLAKLNAALSAINNGQTNVACNKLSDFVNNVGTLISHGDISAIQGNGWISSANHVRNTIGCTNLPCS
jgi:uncharacterized repeat protein (TIGR01451 family)